MRPAGTHIGRTRRVVSRPVLVASKARRRVMGREAEENYDEGDWGDSAMIRSLSELAIAVIVCYMFKPARDAVIAAFQYYTAKR